MIEQGTTETKRVKHKFLTYEIDPQTETLIVGTFNPSTSKDDFFYGSSKNSLWTLLPRAFGEDYLKGKDKEDKKIFIRARRIDFIDLISEVEVDIGEENNRDDEYITRREPEWRNVIMELDKLLFLKRVCFTRKRKGLDSVPKIKPKIQEIDYYCRERKICFACLISPARFYSAAKQTEWSDFFNGRKSQVQSGVLV